MPKPIIQNKPSTGSSSAPSSQSVRKSTRSMSEDTFKKYDDEYKNWKKTGKYSDGFSSWMNQDELNLYKNIKSGNGRSARSNGSYYYMDNDTYDKYGKEYANWKSTNKYSDDFASWKNDDDLNAYKAIRGSRSKQDNAFDDFRNSLNDEILESVRQKYRDKYFGDKNYYDYTGGEIYAQNAGEMPEYLKGKYNQNDPYDKWLYENGLPYSSVFNDLYSEAVNDYNANIQKQKEEYETEKKYLTAENDFRNAVYQQINSMEPDDVTEDTWREVIANVYESDPEKYQEIIGNFNYKAGTEDEIVPGSNEYFASAQKNKKDKENKHAFTVTDLMTEYNGLIEKSQAEYIASLPPEQQEEVASALEGQKIQGQQLTLTQQLRQIDAEIARLGASGWNPNTTRMKELTQQRADIVARLDAVNAEKNEKNRAEDTQKLLNVQNVESTEDIEAELVDLNIKLAGYRQPDGTYRETEDNKELIARHKELEDKLTLTDTAGRSLQNVNTFLAENGGTDQIADTSKWSSKATHNYKALTGQAGRGGKLLKLATAEEIAGANMAASQGEEAFNAYFKDLETVLKYRSTQERKEKFEAMAQQDAVGASMLSVGMNVLGAVEGLGNVLSSAGTGYGNAVDMVYAGYMTSASQTVRSAVSEDIILNNSDQSILPGVTTGQIYSFLYDSGMSMLDTAARMPLGGAGLAIAGLSACDSTILEQLENGATTREAVTLGVVAGFAEYITEKVSLESLLTAKDAGNLKQVLREVCKQMITEGSEEIASEVINIIAEAITLEDNDFTVPGILKRVGMAGLGGMVSGLGFGAAGQAARFARSGRFADRANVKLGKQLTRDLLGKKGGTNFFGKTGEMGKFRVEYTNAVMKSGLSEEAQTDLINLMDQMADDYGFIGTKEGQRLARSLKTLVENESGNHQVLVKQFQEQQTQNQKRLSAMLDNLTNLSEQAASMTNDPEGHSALYQQFMQATQEYQEAQQQIQDKEDISEIKLQEAERKAEQKVLDAVENTANQYQELSAKIAETEAGQQLADLEQQLLNEEVSTSDTEYIKNMSDDTIEDAKVSAMENGDDRTFNLLDEMLEAKHSGDDARIAQFAEKNPDIIEMMWNNELGEAVENGAENVTEEESAISNAVNANKAPTRSAFTGPFASAYENAIYNIDQVKGAIENGRLQQNNGRNAESASAETAEQNGAVRNNGERQNENASEQTNTGRNSEIVKNTQEVKPRRIVAHWTENESKGAENIERLYRENGINLRVNQVENVPEAYGRAMGAAMNFLGNKDGVVLYTQTKDSDDYVMHGQCYNGTPMVRYTGTDSDIAYTYHENGHAHQQYLQMVKDAMGDAYNTVLNKYIETAPESQKGYSRDEMAEEMLCDVFGLFGMHQVFGAEANGNEYINARQLQHVFDTLDNAWADTAYAEDNESVRQIGTDEKYSLSNRSIEAVENRMMEDKYEDVLAPPEDGQPRFSMRTIMHSAGLNMERKNGAFTVTKNGKNVDSITTKDLNGTQIGAIINQAVDRGFVSARDANKEKTFIKDLVNMMIRNKDADMVWAFAGSQVFSAITNNADAQYSKTVDFTTICRKTQAIINAMSERMVELKRGLTDEEILQLQDELAKRGEAVPCPVCYVFSRWVGIGGVLERIKGYQEKYADINVAKKALEEHSDKNAETWIQNVRLQKDYEKHGKVLDDVLFDLNKGSEFASQYPLAWKYRTTRGPALGKAITPYSEMNVGDVVQGMRKNPKKILKGESSPFESIDGEKFGPAALKELLRSESAMRQQNLLGGLRYQSTSDFRTDYALDYLLSFFDVQAVGGKIQTYSKQPDGARLLASVGADVNLSVMPKGKGWKLDADGNEILDSSSITGMDFKTAVALKNQFDNVQLIMVGINDDHIRISLANSDIGFVIPYHASGGKVDFITTMARNLGETVRMQDYQDYADCQTDAINPFATAEQKSAYDLRMRILTGKAKTLSVADQQILDNNPILQNLYNRFYVEGVDPDCYGVKLKKSQANMVMPFEYWDTNSTLETANENGKTFVQYCESLGLIPRFSGKKVANGKIYNLDHGNFVDLDGYWKTLIDRPMYNRDGSYHVQQRINVSGVTSDMLSEDPNLQFTSEAEDEARLSSRDINQVTPQMDVDYMDAVNRGDMETAQRMVDEVARAKGYTVKAFHGTTERFTEFKRGEQGKNHNGYLEFGAGFYFTPNEQEARGWVERGRSGQSGNAEPIVMSVYLNPSRVIGQDDFVPGGSEYLQRLGIPAGDANFIANRTYRFINYLLEDKGFSNTEVQDTLKALGFDAIDATYDFGKKGQYVVFDPEQIKSADPITYRDDGSPIDLSERFNEYERDTRYSSRDINTDAVTARADEDYMDAVDRGDTETAQRMVDERARANGYTQVAFHGTEEDFDEFKANEFATERNGLSNIKGYFDTSSEYAGAYGDVNKYYLKTDNFLHFNNDELGNGTLEDYRKFFEQHGVTDVIFDSAIPNDSLRGGQFEGVDGKSYYTWEILEPAGYYWNGDGNVTERIRAAGYEGISWNEGNENGDVAYMPFNASAIKSADPITYREDGSPIPLSERFDSENPKYRYSNRTIPSMSQRSEDVAKQAEKLFADGTSLTDYYMSGNYDNAVAAQLRTLKLKNGEDVGGKLSEQEVSKIIKDASNWKKGNMYAFKAPVRIFQEVGKWRDTKSKNAADYSRAVSLNMEADEYYSDKYYSYMQQQLADENVFKQGVLDKINAIDPSEQDAILAQLIGERIITPEMARTAVMDSKHILIPIGNGAMVLDRKGRVRYMADQQSLLLFSDDVLKKAAERVRKINEIRNDDKPNKDARIKDVQKSANGPEETMGAYRLEVNGDHYAIVNENGNAVFEMDGENAYSDKAVDLAETLSAIYGSMYDSVQSTLVENGYAPIGHIENYFPHFTQAREGVAGMIDYLKSEDLPVGIAGLTPDFSPGKPWARNLLTRLGDKTDYNAVRGFEGYLNGVSDVIYMTPVIQRFRQLESALRTGMASKTSEEGPVNEANTNFLRWLHDYTNQLANKKPMVDRGVEETFGRKVYTLPTKLSGWIGTAYIGANVRTALTNMASFAQGAGQLAPKWIGRGLFNTATSDQSEFGDDFRNVCTFLINRQSQAEEVALNMGDKFRQRGEKILFGLMEAVDNFSTETIARAKYYQLTQEEGLSSEDALREVSKWCVKLFAERSKGSRATVFNSKVMSPLTQFQIEPFNQLWHWSDIHNENIRSEYRRILRENGGTLDGVDWSNVENQVNKVSVSMKDLKKILGRLIALSVYGMIMRVLTGADATWNPAGIVSDMVNGARKNGAEGAGKAVRKNVMDNIPFSSLVEMIGSAVGLGDDEFGSTTSIPIPALSAVNTAISAIKGGTPESYMEGATYFIPGGGQLRKTAKGVGALVREGSYNKKGKLRYPIDQTPGNAIRAAVFGTSAVAPNGYEYGNVLSEKQTGAYQTAVDQGVDKHDAYDFLMNQYQADSKAYELASLATSDLDDADMRIMAEILGIDVGKGDIKKQAVKEVREQIKSVEKKHEKGTIQDATYEKRIADYEAFLEDLLRG